MAEQVVTLKLRLYPEGDQASLMHECMKQYQGACNAVSGHVYKTSCQQIAMEAVDRNCQEEDLTVDYEQFLVSRKIHDAMFKRVRNDYQISSQMVCTTFRTVVGNYRAILSNNDEWARVVYKRPFAVLQRSKDYRFRKSDGKLGVTVPSGVLYMDWDAKGMRDVMGKGKLGAGTLVERHGKFFLHVPVTLEVDELEAQDICNVVGIDRGMRFLVATYDSQGKTTFVSGKEVKAKRAKYKQLRRDLQRRKTPSARRRLRAIGQRENRWMNDVNHCIAKALVENNPEGTLFVIEDLEGVRNATERVWRRYRYETVSWAYYDLEQKLTYKAALAGDGVLKVDPKYTSQTCPKCGHTERANRDKKLHQFKCCSCGYQSNDDRIGAMNLHRKGVSYVEQSCSDISEHEGRKSIVPR